MMRKRLALAACVIVLVIGCSEHPTSPAPPAPPPPPPPPPGSAVVSLTTPNGDDGAVTITLRGPGISALQASNTGMPFYTRMASDSEARVIIIGNVAKGPLFTFKPAAGTTLTAYSGTVAQVATRTDSLRTSGSGYRVTVTAGP